MPAGNCIGDVGAAALAGALNAKMTLSAISFSCELAPCGAGARRASQRIAWPCRQCDRGIGRLIDRGSATNEHISHGILDLAGARRASWIWKRLHGDRLPGNDIGDSGAAAVAEALMANTSVTRVDLHS
jgi:hypothetical protein